MHLNEWTEQAERWIDLAAWDACSMAADLEDLRGRRCFGGLDLSTTTDVTALAWVFPPDHDDGGTPTSCSSWDRHSQGAAPRTTGTDPRATAPRHGRHGMTTPPLWPRYPRRLASKVRRWVILHVQSNPLPICTRPRVLIKGKRT